MSFADANRASIRIIEETSWGTTPTSGTTREVRLTSSSLSAAKETVVSDEIRADRMVGSITEVSAMSEGDINFEFSAGTTDELLAAFLMGAWSRPMTQDYWSGNTIEVTGASEITVRGTDITGYLTVGRRIKLSGSTSPANDGYYQIAGIAVSGSDTVITTSTATLTAEASNVNMRLFDANDVIVLNNTTVEATANGFSGAGVFASARAAGQLVVGQKVYVEGLGYEEGTISFTAAATDLVLTVSDGVNSKTYTVGTDFQAGADANASAANLAAAINAERYGGAEVLVKAVATGGDVTVTNLRSTGGSITEDTDDAGVTVTAFAGGVAGATGVFKIVSLTDNEIVTFPKPTAVAAGAEVVIKGSMLRNPGDFTQINQRKFTIETGYNDIGQFMIQDGMVPGTFSLEVASGSIITGTIGFQGRATSLKQSTVLGNAANYEVLRAQSGEVVNATTDVGDLLKDGRDFDACIQSLSISGESNLRQQACIGSKFSRGIGSGRFNLTGSMTVFFENESLFRDFIEHETVSLAFAITDAEGSAYYWTIPAVKISQDQIAPGGIDQDVFENIEWTAFRDATTAAMVQIDRFSSTTPV